MNRYIITFFTVLNIFVTIQLFSSFPGLVLNSSIAGYGSGDIKSIIENDPAVFNCNPALINKLKSDVFFAQHYLWYNGTKISDIGYVEIKERYKTQGFFIRTMFSAAMKKTIINYDQSEIMDYTDLGTYRYYSILLSYIYSRKYNESLDMGANLKFIYQKIADYYNYIPVLDVGILYDFYEYKETYYNEFKQYLPDKAALNIINISSSVAFDIKKYYSPITIDLGVLYSFLKNRINAKLEYEFVTTASSKIKTGVDINLFSGLCIRTGYILDFADNSYSGLTLGVGINTNRLIINYATDMNTNLGMVHRIQVQYKM